jgi:thioredoxin 1
MAASINEVTDSNFQAEVIESEVPVLVDFWAPWCGPCRMVAPVVEEIAQERGEALKVVKMNIDENQNTAIQFNVMSIPTLILFNGRGGLSQAQARRRAGAGARVTPAVSVGLRPPAPRRSAARGRRSAPTRRRAAARS